MAKFSLTRLIVEDFPKAYQDLLVKLLYKLNQAFDETNSALRNGLTVADNMAGQETVLDITAPVLSTSPIFFKSTMKGTCKGIICISAQTLSGTAPTGQPFFTFEQSGSDIKVTNITNLVAGSRYNLRVYCFA
jgi:hypothetical protein